MAGPQGTVDIFGLIGPILSVIAIAFSLAFLIRQNRLLRRYRHLLAGEAKLNLEELLLQQEESLNRLTAKLTENSSRLFRIEEEAQLHFQKSGIVRYSAFSDIGSDLSFSVALLDGKNSGVVLSSLYGRSESRVYAKPVRHGVSTYQLSDEEQQAIRRAVERSE